MRPPERKSVILITTSRRPTRGIRTLCHDLARCVPKAFRVNRGKMSLDGVGEKAIELNADRVIIVNRWKGGPGKIELFQVGSEGLNPVPPLLYVAGVRLQREFKTRTRPIRSVAVTITPEVSPEIVKIAESLANFLKVPLSSVGEAASRYQASMRLSLNDTGHIQITFLLFPGAIEVGPRITLSHALWEKRE